MTKKLLYILLLLLFSSIGFGAAIKVNKLTTRNHILYCSLKAYVADVIDMAWILNQGIDLKAKYTISVYKHNPRWGSDFLITNVTIFYKSKRDVINDGYELTVQYGNYVKEYWVSSQEVLFNQLMNTPVTPVISINQLDREQKYYLQFNVSITSLDLYPPLSLIYQLLGRWSYTSPKINSRTFDYDSILED